MNKLFIKLFLYLLPIAVVFLFFEAFYRFAENDYSLKHRLIEKKTDSTKVLIFGNSHPFYGLNPHYFDKPTFNLSHISQTLYFDKLLFDKHIDQFKNLECVILHIEYTTLSEIVNTDENNWRKYYYESYMDLDVPSIGKYDFNRYFLSATRNVNTNAKFVWRYFQEGSWTHCDENGFGTNYTKEKSRPIFEREALKRATAVEDHRIDFTDNTKRVQAIIDKCKSKGIQVILLTLPVTDYFSQNVNPKKVAKMIKTCHILKASNPNVNYLNLFTDSRFGKHDFYDSDHLNTEGAVKSSKIVNAFVNQTVNKQ
ncbi:hypothetical protein ABGT15_01230 [Flavobacterium enshiense]|uniref:hypothetical protein n=1 Tax=Flavobacterium enshiense TaxID=1341165 RepID=UPI00345D1F54